MLPTRTRAKKPRPERHQWFDAWKRARPGGATTLVEEVYKQVRSHEERTARRTRARRSIDEKHHRARIDAIVCNLAHAVLLRPPTGRIAIKLGNARKGRSRYDSPVLGKTLSPLISVLWDLHILILTTPGVVRGEVTSIAPSDRLARKVAEHGIRLSDFGRDQAEEVVLLNRNTRQRAQGSQSSPRKLHREPIDYTETAETRRHRADVRALNEFLRGADIDFVDDTLEPRIDPFDRTLRRRFVLLPGHKERFDHGGRLFGGFWQPLNSKRRAGIRIEGELVTALDYGSMFTRLAYAEVGCTPPGGDLYAIPGLEGYRSGVKMAMNIFLFDGSSPRRLWPSEMGVGVGDDATAKADPRSPAATFKGRLPAGWGVGMTRRAILDIHPTLKGAWGRQLGNRLMFRESEIMIAVLKDLADRGIPVLPLHDGLLVGASREDVAATVMAGWAEDLTGIHIPVSVKAPSDTLSMYEGDDDADPSSSITSENL